jgi:hypothetical protein
VTQGCLSGIQECIAQRHYATDARATTDTVLLRFAYEVFRKGIQTSPTFSFAILRDRTSQKPVSDRVVVYIRPSGSIMRGRSACGMWRQQWDTRRAT